MSTSARRRTTRFTSSFFPSSSSYPQSSLPFPSINAPEFGLVQERLASQPFQLLVATFFLTKTKGTVSIPYFDDLISVFPTPADLAAASPDSLVPFIQSLGLQNRRADAIVRLAKAWIDNPPAKGKRWRKFDYPDKGDGRDISLEDLPLADDDRRSAWEIAHLPGIGPYAIDSWRIFCRDLLRGTGGGGGITKLVTAEDHDTEWEQEWTRVLPTDKELRAYIKWRWLRLGYEWNPETGEKKRVPQAEMERLSKRWDLSIRPEDITTLDYINGIEPGDKGSDEGQDDDDGRENRFERVDWRRTAPAVVQTKVTNYDTQVDGCAEHQEVNDSQVIDDAVAMLSNEREMFDVLT